MSTQTVEKWDKNMSAALGAISILAIFIRWANNDFVWKDLPEVVIDFTSVAIPVLLVFVTIRAFRKPDFYKLLEDAIQLWATQNRYLIDEEIKEEGEGKRRRFFMLTKKHHRNFVTQEKPAREFSTGGQLSAKGAFLYIDKLTDNVLEFRLNEALFKKEAGEVLEYVLSDTASKLVNGINNNFGQVLKLTLDSFQIKEDGRKIIITLDKLEKNEKEVKLIVSLLEYMKTAILAMA
jgi:hypothetical protein